jgi:hypothetical protein
VKLWMRFDDDDEGEVRVRVRLSKKIHMRIRNEFDDTAEDEEENLAL